MKKKKFKIKKKEEQKAIKNLLPGREFSRSTFLSPLRFLKTLNFDFLIFFLFSEASPYFQTYL